MRFILASIAFICCIQSSISQDTLNIPHLSDNASNSEIKVVLDSIEQRITDLHVHNNFAEIIKYSEKGFSLAERIDDVQSILKISRYYGTALMRMNDTIRAGKVLNASYEKAKILQDTTAIVYAVADLGNYYNMLLQDHEKAIEFYNKGIELHTGEDARQLFVLHVNNAHLQLGLDNVAKAEYHLKAIREGLLDKIDSPYLLAAYYIGEGRVELLNGDKDDAIEITKKVISIAEEIDYTDGLIDGYELYIDALVQKRDFEEVYEIRKKLDEYTDRNNALEKEKAINEVMAKMNIEQYKQELKAKELDNQINLQKAEKQEIFVHIMITASFLLVLILVILYNAHQKRKGLVSSLQHKNKQYIKAKQESEKLSKVKNDFLSNITHELRTPLYGIIGISSFLQEDKKLVSHKEDIDSLKFSADYLLSMINDLLFLNKLDEYDSKELEHKPFELPQLITKIINSFEFMKAKSGNEFDIQIDSNVPTYLKGDFTKLSQILINLISNSCKFTEEGTITLAIQASNNENGKVDIHFRVADNGIGISKEKQSVIFNEFTQDSKSNKFVGTGLGLSIVKRLLELHNAKITLKSEKNIGTEFKFAIGYEIAEKSEFKVVEVDEEVDKSIEGSHILIVDDNKLNRLVTRKTLERKKYTCSEAHNGEVAVKMAQEEVFDLILMDLNMPVMDGFEATKNIRDFDANIPIIALTAVDPSQLERNPYKLGFTNVVIKPYEVEEFLDTIKNSFLSTAKV